MTEPSPHTLHAPGIDGVGQLRASLFVVLRKVAQERGWDHDGIAYSMRASWINADHLLNNRVSSVPLEVLIDMCEACGVKIEFSITLPSKD